MMSGEEFGVVVKSFAIGVGDEFKLHPPRCEEIHPVLPFTRVLTRGGITQHGHSLLSQIGNRSVHVGHVERNMVATHIAVARDIGLLIRGLVLKNLEYRLAAESEEVQFPHHRTWVHIEVLSHPVGILMLVGAECVHVFTAQNVDEEAVRLCQVRHCDSDVIEPRDARQSSHGNLRIGYISVI